MMVDPTDKFISPQAARIGSEPGTPLKIATSEVTIEDLKKLSGQRDQQAIIAFCVERDGTVRCVTYGEDKLKCAAAGWWGQGFMKDHISVIPFQTVFGWGHDGKPLALTEKQASQIELLITSGKVPSKFVNKRPETE